MFKRFALIISLCILVGIALALAGVFAINQITWNRYQQRFLEEKETLIAYYMNNIHSDTLSGIQSNAYWTEAKDRLDQEDDEWLATNATTYITDMELFHTDYILIANESTSFIQESAGSYAAIILELSSVQQALRDNVTRSEMIRLDHMHALVVASPFMDDQFNNPSGVYVAMSIIDEYDFYQLKQLLNKSTTSDLYISKDPAGPPPQSGYYEIYLTSRILETDYYLHSTFQLDDSLKTFTIQRNHIISIVTMTSVIVCIIILLFIKATAKRISDINITVKDIASGNYGVEIPLKEKEMFQEISDLSQSVNTLSRDIQTHLRVIDNNYLEMTEVIVNAVEINDQYTSQHNREVGVYASIIAEEIGYQNIGDIVMAAKLHDIGKISIPGTILNKPGRLTPEEYEIIKTHPSEGYKIIENIEYFEHIKLGVKHHHERWDGTGYPDGLVQNAIPLIAQIIAIADVYDAVTSDRAYRKGLSHDEAVAIILENSNIMFNPLLVKAFLEREEDFRDALNVRRGETS